MSATGRKATRAPADFYATPAWAVEAIMGRVLGRLPDHAPIVYDCGAGEGAILSAFSSVYNKANLQGCELRPSAAARCRAQGFHVTTSNWLGSHAPLPRTVGAICMNPPYGGHANTAMRFVEAGLQRLQHGASLWALLRVNWLLDGESTHERTTWMKSGPGLPDIYALNARPSFTGDGQSDATTYAWMHWVVGLHQDVSAFHLLEVK